MIENKKKCMPDVQKQIKILIPNLDSQNRFNRYIVYKYITYYKKMKTLGES